MIREYALVKLVVISNYVIHNTIMDHGKEVHDSSAYYESNFNSSEEDRIFLLFNSNKIKIWEDSKRSNSIQSLCLAKENETQNLKESIWFHTIKKRKAKIY